MKAYIAKTFTDFVCLHCRNFVSANRIFSGVEHRNHCPYCLFSRHLDLYESGDRLAACKGRMEPIGLAQKALRKKYPPRQGGEWMVIHRCTDCGRLVTNRIAADDYPERLGEVYQAGAALDEETRAELRERGIRVLTRLEDIQRETWAAAVNGI